MSVLFILLLCNHNVVQKHLYPKQTLFVLVFYNGFRVKIYYKLIEYITGEKLIKILHYFNYFVQNSMYPALFLLF